MSSPTLTQSVIEAYDAITPDLPPLYLEEIPEDVAQLQAAYYVHQGESPVYQSGQTKPSLVEGRFAIVMFSKLAADLGAGETALVELETRAVALMAAFTPNALSLNSPQQATLLRGSYTLQATKLRDKDNNPVYMATIPYLCKIGLPAV